MQAVWNAVIARPRPSAGDPTSRQFLSGVGALLTGLALGAGLVVSFAKPAGGAEQAEPAGAAAV